MKVYVVTKAELLQPEEYVTVCSTKKAAEKVIRDRFPNARPDAVSPNSNHRFTHRTSYTCKAPGSDKMSLMFILEEELQ